MPEPASILVEAYELSQSSPNPMSEHAAYSTLHGGCGMLLVCVPQDADTIIAEAAADGIVAYVVGETTASESQKITITSRFGKKQQLSPEHPA